MNILSLKDQSPIKITIEGGIIPHKTIQLTLNWDANIYDWVEAFKTVLIHQNFDYDTVKELFESVREEMIY